MSRRDLVPLSAAILVVAALAVVSVFVGVADLSPADLVGGLDDEATMVLLVSRVPRTVAIVLSGMAIGIAGLVMQMLSRNRFVEPSTVGTTESAGLGILAVTLLAPSAGLLTKMVVASAFAVVGTLVFLGLIRRVRHRGGLVVPLIGLMLGAVVASVATFVAYRFDLLQTLNSWMLGDFSGVLRGRYELLWIAAVLVVVAYVAADRLTVAGMGEDFSTNLGLHHGRSMALGLGVVAVVAAVVVVTVGNVPFLGLVVPNVAALVVGDNLRRSMPWVAVLGAGLILACDVAGRVVRYPYEIPIGVVMGVVGSALFLHLLLRRPAHAY